VYGPALGFMRATGGGLAGTGHPGPAQAIIAPHTTSLRTGSQDVSPPKGTMNEGLYFTITHCSATGVDILCRLLLRCIRPWASNGPPPTPQCK